MAPSSTKLNKPAPNAPYYTPAQEPAPGTALRPSSATPTLFTPLTMRGITIPNRLVVSPMCTYSAADGHLTDWHLVHLGQFALHGAGLVFVEATAVQAVGRISPEDSGLWQESQIAPLKKITDYIHSQGGHAAIQLAHAGRKASTLAPWIAGSVKKALANEENDGWPDATVAPSAIPYAEGYPLPKELSIGEVEQAVKDFAAAAKRAVEAGFDIIEIHGAHGYLVNQFLSPITNRRTDRYGGSFENRTRFLIEIIQAVRAVIPESMPLWLRISATEWMEHTDQPSWDVPQSTQLAKLLPGLGIDLLDVSSGGNNAGQKIELHPYYQVNIAGQIRAAIKADGLELLIGAVGLITQAEMARGIVQVDEGKPIEGVNGTVEIVDEQGKDAQADLVLMARQFLREPNWVIQVAAELGVEIKLANQYHRRPRKVVKL